MKKRVVQVLLVGAIASTLSATVGVAPLGAEDEFNNTTTSLQMNDNENAMLSRGILTNDNIMVALSFLDDTNEAAVINTESSKVTEPGEVSEVEEVYDYTGWASTPVNVRTAPNTESEVLKVLSFNEEIDYCPVNDDWVKIQLNNGIGYVNANYISSTKFEYNVKYAPMTSGKKSWMPYTALTSRSSNQYRLQQMCSTGNYGIRTYNGRYCVALGSYYTDTIGQYFDLVLANGTVIPCVLGDQKADVHTDTANQVTVHNGCMSEFIVDTSSLDSDAKRDGDISSCTDEWDSRVVEIRIYDEYAL